MRLTRQHRRNARLLWQAVIVNGVPDANLIKEAVQTVRKYEGRCAEAVLRCFVQRLEVYIRETQISVVSANQLVAWQQDQLIELFCEKVSVKAGVRFFVDPTVIGGLRVERGYQVTDLTIMRQLEVLRDKLLGK